MSTLISHPDLSWLKSTVGPDGKITSQKYTQEDYDENPEQVQRWISDDEKRLKAYGEDWIMLGCVAEAEILIPELGIPVYVETPGVWGVASDSDEDYKRGLEREQLGLLRKMLTALNVDASHFHVLRIN